MIVSRGQIDAFAAVWVEGAFDRYRWRANIILAVIAEVPICSFVDLRFYPGCILNFRQSASDA